MCEQALTYVLFLNLEKPFQEPPLASEHILASPQIERVPRITWIELYMVCKIQDATKKCHRVVQIFVQTPHLPRIPTGKNSTRWMSRHSGVQCCETPRPIYRTGIDYNDSWTCQGVYQDCLCSFWTLIAQSCMKTYFYITTFRSMCPVPNMAVYGLSLMSCFPVCCSGIFRMILRWFLLATPRTTGYYYHYY